MKWQKQNRAEEKKKRQEVDVKETETEMVGGKREEEGDRAYTQRGKIHTAGGSRQTGRRDIAIEGGLSSQKHTEKDVQLPVLHINNGWVPLLFSFLLLLL